jgi:hypothetical protein
MSLSSFSLVIGVLFYVFGFPFIFADDAYLNWCRKSAKDENVLRILGATFLALSVTTLKYQWRVTADGEGIIIVVAWVVLLKGIFMAWWPRRFMKVRARWENVINRNPQLQSFAGFVMVLLGALFTYFGLVLA